MPLKSIARAVRRAFAPARAASADEADLFGIAAPPSSWLTSQSYIARIEGGRVRPSTAVLERLAKATGTRLQIRFVAERRSRGKVLATLSKQPTRELKRSAASIVRAARDAR